MTTGIDTYIIKTASRCNLNCTYCYYYNAADTSYLNRPKFMSRDVIKRLTDEIINHSRAHDTSSVDLTLHGGEPLLMSKSDFSFMMEEFDRIDQAGVTTRRKCQTNAVLLDDEWVDLLADRQILLGISIDGTKLSHDRYRVDHAGRGSYERTVKGLGRALGAAGNGLRTSVLCFVNPEHGGAEMYYHLRSLGVKRMDFLLPESNYAHPPAGYVPLGAATPYGDYLISVFDAWIGENDSTVHVRLLDRIVRSLAGQVVNSDVISTAPVRVAVIETDGSMEPTDNFKACADRMTDLGLNILTHSVDRLYNNDFFRLCLESGSSIPSACGACDFFRVCGSGRITTRYSAEDQFRRRTIYCNDLLKLYRHIRRTIAPVLARRENEPSAV